MRRLACAIIATLSAVATNASAETLTFRFSGVVTYGGAMGVPVGTAVVGAYSYDTETSPAIDYNGFADYQIPAPASMTLSFSGHTVTSGALGVSVWNHFKGNVEDMINVTGGGVMLDDTAFPGGAVGFQLASSPRNNRALKGKKLPSSLEVGLFNAGPTLNYGFLQTDGGPQGMQLQFTVDSVVATAGTP